MKNIYFLLFALLGFYSNANEQDSITNQQFEEFKKPLVQWDERRGEWLATSLRNIANGEEIPTRTFPENLTPAQLLLHVPTENRRAAVASIPNSTGSNSPRQNSFWNSIRTLTNSTQCSMTRSRSYGDPHIADLNGNRYSFQTVGEFVMLKNDKIEVQVRQKAIEEHFSLNTAVAMNVNGDRLCIYADDSPDVTFDTPVRLNGRPIYLTASTFFLPHGGTITKAKNQYTIYFATGEIVSVRMRNRSMDGFMDISADISECRKTEYSGFIVDSQGREMASNDSRNYSNDAFVNKQIRAEKVRLFAQPFRITDVETLFDYPLGRTTSFYTDLMYPKVVMSINDMNNRDLRRSQKHCERFRGTPNYNSCLFDQGFLGLDNAPEPVVETGRGDVVVRPIPNDRLLDNVNPGERPRPVSPRFSTIKEQSQIMDGIDKPRPQTLPKETGNPIKTEKEEIKKPIPVKKPSIDRPVERKPVAKPVQPKPRPVVKPKPVVRPKPVVKPRAPKPKPPVVRPTPRPAPRPKPKPAPVPKPKIPIKKG